MVDSKSDGATERARIYGASAAVRSERKVTAERACGCGFRRTQAIVLTEAPRAPDNGWMHTPSLEPSPGPWTFAEHMYGIAHCLIDRDGRVLGCNIPIGNGPLLEQAPAMAALLRELVAGVPAPHLRDRARQVLDRIDAGQAREPGEDDE